MPGSSTTGPTRTRRTRSISYYVKGAVIGFLLDAKLRRLTGGARSRSTTSMRLMYARFSGRKGFRAQDVRAAVADVAGPAKDARARAWLARASRRPPSSTTPMR